MAYSDVFSELRRRLHGNLDRDAHLALLGVSIVIDGESVTMTVDDELAAEIVPARRDATGRATAGGTDSFRELHRRLSECSIWDPKVDGLGDALQALGLGIEDLSIADGAAMKFSIDTKMVARIVPFTEVAPTIGTADLLDLRRRLLGHTDPSTGRALAAGLLRLGIRIAAETIGLTLLVDDQPAARVVAIRSAEGASVPGAHHMFADEVAARGIFCELTDRLTPGAARAASLDVALSRSHIAIEAGAGRILVRYFGDPAAYLIPVAGPLLDGLPESDDSDGPPEAPRDVADAMEALRRIAEEIGAEPADLIDGLPLAVERFVAGIKASDNERGEDLRRIGCAVGAAPGVKLTEELPGVVERIMAEATRKSDAAPARHVTATSTIDGVTRSLDVELLPDATTAECIDTATALQRLLVTGGSDSATSPPVSPPTAEREPPTHRGL